MKRIGMLACVALTLCANPQRVRAHGCELLWALPLALGVGAAIGSAFAPHPTYVYPPPTYVYSPPVYAYSYAPPSHASMPSPTVYNYNQTQPMTAQRSYVPAAGQIVQRPAASAQAIAWTPRTVGTGHWVPDPQPYSYGPQNGLVTTVASKSDSRGVSVSGSPGSVPVYVVSR